MRNLASSLIEHGAIETTEGESEGAPSLRGEADHEGAFWDAPFASARWTARPEARDADKLFQESGPFAKRAGGYTRILKTATARVTAPRWRASSDRELRPMPINRNRCYSLRSRSRLRQ
jgi:ribosomal protein L17